MRPRSSLRARAGLWTRQLLLALDQLAHVVIAFFTYVLLGRGSIVDADETISSRVGRAAARGSAWGLCAARMIDRLFVFLGDGPNHCRRSIEHRVRVRHD